MMVQAGVETEDPCLAFASYASAYHSINSPTIRASQHWLSPIKNLGLGTEIVSRAYV